MATKDLDVGITQDTKGDVRVSVSKPGPAKPSLFMFYSRKDIESVRRLTEAFKGQDLDFWINWKGIHLTVDWPKAIEQGMEEPDGFLFLLSPDSAAPRVAHRRAVFYYWKELENAVYQLATNMSLVIRESKEVR